MNNLSLRLSTIASLVPIGARVCDIGTDHGYLSIYLKSSNIASRIIAADVNSLPLENAKKNILKSGVEDIELRLSNGFEKISCDEFDVAVIAGIGGEVIAGILENGMNVIAKEDKLLILQPTTSPEFLRKSLYSNGFKILSETPVMENDKIYSVMLISFVGEIKTKPEYFYYIGKVPKDNHYGILYIKKQYKRLNNCAKALENVTAKHKEYLYYKELSDNIKNYLEN